MVDDSAFEIRRDPDAILRQIKEAERSDEPGRGKLKIFFGYAAGVGKTYAMLEDAHGYKEKGFDVVAGYIEPHTRADTTALLDGLEQLERRTIEHRGIALREFDLDAALKRKPQILLVDELAHTNAPGSRHRKRYQDIEELLRAGINVFTTVNVQHLEGLNDKISAITQVRVAERIPDSVFDRADSVELIDIEPDDLIERLNAGKVYVPDRSWVALSNFFTKKNLAALREIALRRMADRMTRSPDADGTACRVEAGEDVLVYVTPDAGNVKVIRAAANMAEAFHGALTALVIESSESKKLDVEERQRLRSNIDLAEELGAHVVTMHGDDVAVLISQYSMTAGITQLVLGSNSSGKGLFSSKENLVNRLTHLSYGAVINVVPVKDLPAQFSRFRPATGFKLTSGDVLKALLAVALATAIGLAVHELGLASSVILMGYMFVILLIATRADGFFYSLIAALGSVLAYNFFFTVPRFTFDAYGINYPFIFVFLMVSTLVASSLTVRMKRQSEATARRAYRTEVLLESTRELQASTSIEACFATAAKQIMKILDRPVVMYKAGSESRLSKPVVYDVPGSGGGDAQSAELVSPYEVAVASWVAANNERAGATTSTLAEARCLYLPIRSKGAVFGVAGLVMEEDSEDFGSFEKNLLIALLDECGQACEQIDSARERHEMRTKAEKEELRSNLLRMISHDLRTPLTSISGDADMLLSEGARLSEAQKQRMYEDIYEDSSWLISLVENLLSVTRIDDGSIELNMQPEIVGDIVREAVSHTNRKGAAHDIRVDVPDELLMVKADARLIMQVIINLVNNAISYTPPGSRIEVSAHREKTETGHAVRIAVADNGSGVPDADKERIFGMFFTGSMAGSLKEGGDAHRSMGLGLALCRSIVRVHGDDLTISDAEPHGSVFSFMLPEATMDGLGHGGGLSDSEHED